MATGVNGNSPGSEAGNPRRPRTTETAIAAAMMTSSYDASRSSVTAPAGSLVIRGTASVRCRHPSNTKPANKVALTRTSDPYSVATNWLGAPSRSEALSRPDSPTTSAHTTASELNRATAGTARSPPRRTTTSKATKPPTHRLIAARCTPSETVAATWPEARPPCPSSAGAAAAANATPLTTAPDARPTTARARSATHATASSCATRTWPTPSWVRNDVIALASITAVGGWARMSLSVSTP